MVTATSNISHYKTFFFSNLFFSSLLLNTNNCIRMVIISVKLFVTFIFLDEVGSEQRSLCGRDSNLLNVSVRRWISYFFLFHLWFSQWFWQELLQTGLQKLKIIIKKIKFSKKLYLYRLLLLRSIAQFFTQTYMNCFVSS